MEIVRTDEEIEKLEAWALEGIYGPGGSHYSGQSYEEGIIVALDWLSGRRDESPVNDE
jgi:hypothetical protein